MSDDNDKCEGCSFPPLSEQALSLGKSLADSMLNALKLKGVKASKEEVQKRIKTCEGCQYLKDNRCLECGCFISFKAGLKHEKCPKGKW